MKILGLDLGSLFTPDAPVGTYVDLNARINPINIDVAALPNYAASASGSFMAPAAPAYFTGDKFIDGFGSTLLLEPDYWLLRQRSAQLFTTNLYARGLIRRMVNNEINTGLSLESTPVLEFIKLAPESSDAWTESVEARFGLWAGSTISDFEGRETFQGKQRSIRFEALVEGDVLVVMRQHAVTKLPTVQCVPGGLIRAPAGVTPKAGHKIVEGVELDAQGRHIRFWVLQPDGTSKPIEAVGAKSGRRIAWLVYGTDKRHERVRGEPLLSLVMQSLREVDRYRDATLRKAVVNSILAMFISKGEDKPGTLPITGGAVRRSTISGATTPASTGQTVRALGHVPGLVLEELQSGEQPHAFNTGIDVNFGPFEDSIIQAIAWANEMPPEILRLSFSSNYSASQAGINEFKLYLNRVRAEFADAVCKPVYADWLLSQVLLNKIEAPGLAAAWRNVSDFETFEAWCASDWAGAIKPSADMAKTVKAYVEMLNNNLITYARATRELTGMKFTRVVDQLAVERALIAASRPAPAVTGASDTPAPGPDDPPAAGDNEALGLLNDILDAVHDAPAAH